MTPKKKTPMDVVIGFEDWMSIVSFAAMVVIVIIIVLCRYVFEVTFLQGEEIARYLMIWCGYTGAAYGFRKHSHVGVVVFSEMLPKKWYPHVLRIRHIAVLIIVCALFIFTCTCFNAFLSTGQITTSTKLPMAFVYIILPISMALGILHTLMDVIDNFRGKVNNTEEVTEA